MIAKELQKLGVQAFCVATALEGVELRQSGILRGDSFVLGYTHPSSFPLLRRYRLTLTVVDFDYAQALNGYGKEIRVHIGVDTDAPAGENWENLNRIRHPFHMRNWRRRNFSPTSAPPMEKMKRTSLHCYAGATVLPHGREY